MLFISSSGLENAKKLIVSYKEGKTKEMTADLWRAKQIVDSTLHPGMLNLDILIYVFNIYTHTNMQLTISDTGKPVFLPFRMSSFVLSNLVVTAGMLTPGLQV